MQEVKFKRIAVCCDGTWNSDDTQTDDTNVSLLARSIPASSQNDGTLQIVLYLRGVGTTGLKFEDLIAGAVGVGVDENIRSAYQFIAQNYAPGDEIYLFGFSRGAFTVRSLAGLITACGILYRQSLSAMPAAWAYYRERRAHAPAEFADLAKVQCHATPEITFLGVWDTVGSLGIPGGLLKTGNKEMFAFHNTSPSPLVRRAAHALAIDEHRRDFTPTFWTGETPPGALIQQVWFAGAHSDVGGGYRTRALANIPLVWMAKQAESAGLALDWSASLKSAVLDPLAPSHDSASGLFALDRYHPTLRCVGMKPFNVGLNASLYQALDENGKPVATINEAVHQSVLDRYAGLAKACSDDKAAACQDVTYRPENIASFFAGKKFAGLPVVV